jgi:hypothetical protein
MGGCFGDNNTKKKETDPPLPNSWGESIAFNKLTNSAKLMIGKK